MSQAPADRPAIRTTVPLVVVPTSVTDKQGHFIPGLTESDFFALDDGTPRREIHVDSIDSGGLPSLAVVALVQTSDISSAALAKIRKVGSLVSDAIAGADGKAAVMSYDSDIRVVQDFTTDSSAVVNAFRNLRQGDDSKARVVDAVEQALTMLDNLPLPHRKLIVIIGENKDRGSETKIEDLLSRLHRGPVMIDTLVYSAYLTPFTQRAKPYTPPNGGGLFTAIDELVRLGKQNTSKLLSSVTGGRYLRFETSSKLEHNLSRVADDVHNRYFLSFTPDLAKPAHYHVLDVYVKPPADAVVVARSGYWASGGISQ